MPTIFRLAAAAAGVVASSLLTLILLPWVGGPHLFGGNPAGLLRSISDERDRGAKLAACVRLIEQSNAEKAEVCREVIRGRLTLSDAVERFVVIHHRLNDDLDGAGDARPVVPQMTDRKELQDRILYWIEASLRDQPALRATTLRRLEGERRQPPKEHRTRPQAL